MDLGVDHGLSPFAWIYVEQAALLDRRALID